MHHFVTAPFELVKQLRKRFGGVLVEVVHQKNTFAALFQLTHHRLNHLLRLVHLEVARIDVGREYCDVTLAEIGEKLRCVLQVREAEERRDRRAGSSHMHCAVAHLDLLLGLLENRRIGVPREVLVRPGVSADSHPGLNHLFGDFGMPHCVLADVKERGFQTLIGQRLEHRRRALPPGAIVEGQDDLLVAQEVVPLEVLEAESGAAGGVDLDDA